MAPKIVPVLNRAALSSTGRYVEPFVGGGAILEAVGQGGAFERMQAGDLSLDLILMWRALQLGWDPPAEVPYDLYEQVRRGPPSALRGFVGFGCSTYGKWFGGYARHEAGNNNSTKPRDSRKSCLRAVPHIKKVRFFHRSYLDWKLEPGDVVYCDPPYCETTGYAAQEDDFDHALFWAWCKEQADREVRIIVSESKPPPMEGEGWVSAWWVERTVMVGDSHKMSRKDNQIIDALYVPEWLAPRVLEDVTDEETFPRAADAW